MDSTLNNNQVNPGSDSHKDDNGGNNQNQSNQIGIPPIDPDVKLSMDGTTDSQDGVPIQYVDPVLPPSDTLTNSNMDGVSQTNDHPLPPTFQHPRDDSTSQKAGNPAVLDQTPPSSDVNPAPSLHPQTFSPPVDDSQAQQTGQTVQPDQPSADPTTANPSSVPTDLSAVQSDQPSADPATVKPSSVPTDPSAVQSDQSAADPTNVNPTSVTADPSAVQPDPTTPSPTTTNPAPLSSATPTQQQDNSSQSTPNDPDADDESEPYLTVKIHPEDLDMRWNSWKCLECDYVYEGQKPIQQCPRCGNDDPDKFD